MIMCSRCHKRPAVVFITRSDGKEQKNEGLCIMCAKELGIKPIDDIVKKFGMDDEELEAMSEQLMSLGVSISIDDFGTEYSSLSRLCVMPIDRLKLDMQFVRSIGRSPKENAIIQGIISISHSLGLTVVAEGVETEAQLDFLTKARCDEIQGYLFSPPVPAGELEQILKLEGRLEHHPVMARS